MRCDIFTEKIASMSNYYILFHFGVVNWVEGWHSISYHWNWNQEPNLARLSFYNSVQPEFQKAPMYAKGKQCGCA